MFYRPHVGRIVHQYAKGKRERPGLSPRPRGVTRAVPRGPSSPPSGKKTAHHQAFLADRFQYDELMRRPNVTPPPARPAIPALLGLLAGFAVLAGPAAGCFNPDLSQVTLLCDPTQPECPEGQTCIDNRCVPPGADLAASDTDGGAGGGDLGLPTGSGCADGSRTAVGVAYACAGGFSAGKARPLCASGWRVCTKAAGIDQTACGKLSGFFFADVPASYQGNPGNESCNGSSSNQLWYGCGSRQTGVRMGARGCQGFINLLECRNATGVTCSSGNLSLDTTADSASTDGVLCCQ